MGMYALYMASHGNMEGIFSGNPHAVPLRDPTLYDIPQETLDADPAFARSWRKPASTSAIPMFGAGQARKPALTVRGL